MPTVDSVLPIKKRVEQDCEDTQDPKPKGGHCDSKPIQELTINNNALLKEQNEVQVEPAPTRHRLKRGDGKPLCSQESDNDVDLLFDLGENEIQPTKSVLDKNPLPIKKRNRTTQEREVGVEYSIQTVSAPKPSDNQNGNLEPMSHRLKRRDGNPLQWQAPDDELDLLLDEELNDLQVNEAATRAEFNKYKASEAITGKVNLPIKKRNWTGPSHDSTSSQEQQTKTQSDKSNSETTPTVKKRRLVRRDGKALTLDKNEAGSDSEFESILGAIEPSSTERVKQNNVLSNHGSDGLPEQDKGSDEKEAKRYIEYASEDEPLINWVKNRKRKTELPADEFAFSTDSRIRKAKQKKISYYESSESEFSESDYESEDSDFSQYASHRDKGSDDDAGVTASENSGSDFDSNLDSELDSDDSLGGRKQQKRDKGATKQRKPQEPKQTESKKNQSSDSKLVSKESVKQKRGQVTSERSSSKLPDIGYESDNELIKQPRHIKKQTQEEHSPKDCDVANQSVGSDEEHLNAPKAKNQKGNHVDLQNSQDSENASDWEDIDEESGVALPPKPENDLALPKNNSQEGSITEEVRETSIPIQSDHVDESEETIEEGIVEDKTHLETNLSSITKETDDAVSDNPDGQVDNASIYAPSGEPLFEVETTENGLSANKESDKHDETGGQPDDHNVQESSPVSDQGPQDQSEPTDTSLSNQSSDNPDNSQEPVHGRVGEQITVFRKADKDNANGIAGSLLNDPNAEELKILVGVGIQVSDSSEVDLHGELVEQTKYTMIPKVWIRDKENQSVIGPIASEVLLEMLRNLGSRQLSQFEQESASEYACRRLKRSFTEPEVSIQQACKKLKKYLKEFPGYDNTNSGAVVSTDESTIYQEAYLKLLRDINTKRSNDLLFIEDLRDTSKLVEKDPTKKVSKKKTLKSTFGKKGEVSLPMAIEDRDNEEISIEKFNKKHAARLKLVSKQQTSIVDKRVKAAVQPIGHHGSNPMVQQSWEQVNQEKLAHLEQHRQKSYQQYTSNVDKKQKIPCEYLNDGITLYPYQHYCVEYGQEVLKNECGLLIADDMGLGKTIQSIALASYCKQQLSPGKKTLILAPKSTIENWKKEIQRFSDLSYVQYDGNNEVDCSDKDVVICTYELFVNRYKTISVHWLSELLTKCKVVNPKGESVKSDKKYTEIVYRNLQSIGWLTSDGNISQTCKDLLSAVKESSQGKTINDVIGDLNKKAVCDPSHTEILAKGLFDWTCSKKQANFLNNGQFSSLILDEAHRIKNDDTQRSIAIKQFPAKYRIALTGTPIHNGLFDLYSLQEFLNPGMLSSKDQFSEDFGSKFIDAIAEMNRWIEAQGRKKYRFTQDHCEFLAQKVVAVMQNCTVPLLDETRHRDVAYFEHLKQTVHAVFHEQLNKTHAEKQIDLIASATVNHILQGLINQGRSVITLDKNTVRQAIASVKYTVPTFHLLPGVRLAHERLHILRSRLVPFVIRREKIDDIVLTQLRECGGKDAKKIEREMLDIQYKLSREQLVLLSYMNEVNLKQLGSALGAQGMFERDKGSARSAFDVLQKVQQLLDHPFLLRKKVSEMRKTLELSEDGKHFKKDDVRKVLEKIESLSSSVQSGKMNAALEKIQQIVASDEKVIVSVNYVESARMLQRELGLRGRAALYLYGQLSAEARQLQVELFMGNIQKFTKDHVKTLLTEFTVAYLDEFVSEMYRLSQDDSVDNAFLKTKSQFCASKAIPERFRCIQSKFAEIYFSELNAYKNNPELYKQQSDVLEGAKNKFRKLMLTKPNFEYYAKILNECSGLDNEGLCNKFENTGLFKAVLQDILHLKQAKIFIVNYKAGGEGINLQAANNVIMFDLSWNPADNEQIIARAYRIGQDKKVNVYRMYTEDDLTEVKIWEKAKLKQDLANLVLCTSENTSHQINCFFENIYNKIIQDKQIEAEILQLNEKHHEAMEALQKQEAEQCEQEEQQRQECEKLLSKISRQQNQESSDEHDEAPVVQLVNTIQPAQINLEKTASAPVPLPEPFDPLGYQSPLYAPQYQQDQQVAQSSTTRPDNESLGGIPMFGFDDLTGQPNPGFLSNSGDDFFQTSELNLDEFKDDDIDDLNIFLRSPGSPGW